MADIPVKSVRVVQLVERAATSFVWVFEDDGTDYSAPFSSQAEAQSWLFTPVCIVPPDPPPAPPPVPPV